LAAHAFPVANTVATQHPAAGALRRPGRAGLRREIGFIGLLWASGGSIIGSGWLFGAQGALAAAGPAAIISWGIGAIAILLLALMHAELGAMYPVAGGTARFPHYAFGGAVGASFGWFSWLQAATVAPIEVMAVIQYGQHYSFASGWMKVSGGQNVLTGTGIVAAIVLMAIFTAVNFLSVRKLAHTNSTATWWKVGVPLLTIVVLAIVGFHPGNFSAADGFAPDGASGVLAAVSTSGIIFALLGFEQADQLAGESANPRRDIPRAVIGAIAIGATIYILLQIVFLGALPGSQIGATWANSPYTTFSGPFAQLASLVGVGWLASILYIDAVISPGGTGLIYTTATSRVSYGLSRNGYVPSVYERTDRRGIPWVGLITAFVIGCICFLPFPSWRSLVGLITSASVLMYAGAPLALGAFRARLPEAERPYRAPAARVLAPLAFAVANLLILWSGWTTDWKLGVAILIGYVILAANRLFKLNPTTPQFEVRSAVWLPVYLLGMGLIVYLSDFGPTANPWFPLWWDMLAVTVFSLAIYFWAQRVALPSGKMEELVSRGAVVDVEPAVAAESAPAESPPVRSPRVAATRRFRRS
jgi:amino acid transporter